MRAHRGIPCLRRSSWCRGSPGPSRRRSPRRSPIRPVRWRSWRSPVPSWGPREWVPRGSGPSGSDPWASARWWAGWSSASSAGPSGSGPLRSAGCWGRRWTVCPRTGSRRARTSPGRASRCRTEWPGPMCPERGAAAGRARLGGRVTGRLVRGDAVLAVVLVRRLFGRDALSFRVLAAGGGSQGHHRAEDGRQQRARAHRDEVAPRTAEDSHAPGGRTGGGGG